MLTLPPWLELCSFAGNIIGKDCLLGLGTKKKSKLWVKDNICVQGSTLDRHSVVIVLPKYVTQVLYLRIYFMIISGWLIWMRSNSLKKVVMAKAISGLVSSVVMWFFPYTFHALTTLWAFTCLCLSCLFIFLGTQKDVWDSAWKSQPFAYLILSVGLGILQDGN